MKRLAGIFLAVCLVFAAGMFARAQETGGHKPPKILTIIREYVKPGKDGAPHEKTEALYVDALTRAKTPAHYIGLTSVTGRPRCLFFEGFDSIEQWRKQEAEEYEKAGAALDHASQADGELLESSDRTVWYLDEEGSYNTSIDLPHVRYFEIERFQIRQGREHEWNEGVKLVKAALSKATPDTHWAMYSAIYGISTPTYLILTPLKSAAEIDRSFADNPKFVAAMGEEGMKKLQEMSAAAIEASESNLFAIEPKMSYVGDDIAKADPGFWRPKSTSASSAKKAPEKPKEKP